MSGIRTKPPAKCRGFSYVEIMLTAVIMSVLVVAGLQLSGNLGRSSRNALDQDLAGKLALDLIREIKDLRYKDDNQPTHFGLESDEDPDDREDFDDIDDYHNWSAAPPVDRDGNVVGPADLTRSVIVCYVQASDFTSVNGADQGFKQVIISIHRGDLLLAEQIYILADIDDD